MIISDCAEIYTGFGVTVIHGVDVHGAAVCIVQRIVFPRILLSTRSDSVILVILRLDLGTAAFIRAYGGPDR